MIGCCWPNRVVFGSGIANLLPTALASVAERLTPQVEGPIDLGGVDEALEGVLRAFTTYEGRDHTARPLGRPWRKCARDLLQRHDFEPRGNVKLPG